MREDHRSDHLWWIIVLIRDACDYELRTKKREEEGGILGLLIEMVIQQVDSTIEWEREGEEEESEREEKKSMTFW